MLRKITLAIAAAALIGFAIAPDAALARGGHGGGGHGGGMHFGGGHAMHFGGGHARFHGFHGFRRSRFAFGFYPGLYAYSGYPYYDDGCYLRRRVVGTPWGPRVRLVRVCGYY